MSMPNACSLSTIHSSSPLKNIIAGVEEECARLVVIESPLCDYYSVHPPPQLPRTDSGSLSINQIDALATSTPFKEAFQRLSSDLKLYSAQSGCNLRVKKKTKWLYTDNSIQVSVECSRGTIHFSRLFKL